MMGNIALHVLRLPIHNEYGQGLMVSSLAITIGLLWSSDDDHRAHLYVFKTISYLNMRCGYLCIDSKIRWQAHGQAYTRVLAMVAAQYMTQTLSVRVLQLMSSS